LNSVLTGKLHRIIDALETEGAKGIRIVKLTDHGDRVEIGMDFSLVTEEHPAGDFEEA